MAGKSALPWGPAHRSSAAVAAKINFLTSRKERKERVKNNWAGNSSNDVQVFLIIQECFALFFIQLNEEKLYKNSFVNTVDPKKIYRLKEDQAFSLSLELGRRSKVAQHPSADFLQSPLQPVAYLFIADNDAPSLLRRGWSGFCRYYYCSENAFKRMVSRDSLSSIFIQFYEVISVHSYVR